MLKHLLVRTALLAGPRMQIYATKKEEVIANAWDVARENTDETFALIHETDSAILTPRRIHLIAAEQALGCKIDQICSDPKRLAYDTAGPDDQNSDLSARVQAQLGQPASDLQRFRDQLHEAMPLAPGQALPAIYVKNGFESAVRHALRVEQLLCIRNPLTPAQQNKQLTRSHVKTPRLYKPRQYKIS